MSQFSILSCRFVKMEGGCARIVSIPETTIPPLQARLGSSFSSTKLDDVFRDYLQCISFLGSQDQGTL